MTDENTLLQGEQPCHGQVYENLGNCSILLEGSELRVYYVLRYPMGPGDGTLTEMFGMPSGRRGKRLARYKTEKIGDTWFKTTWASFSVSRVRDEQFHAYGSFDWIRQKDPSLIGKIRSDLEEYRMLHDLGRKYNELLDGATGKVDRIARGEENE